MRSCLAITSLALAAAGRYKAEPSSAPGTPSSAGNIPFASLAPPSLRAGSCNRGIG